MIVDVYAHHIKRRIGAVVVVLLNVVGRSWKYRWICKQCGYEWKGNAPDRVEHAKH